MNGEMDFMILNNKVKGVQGTVDNIDTKIDSALSSINSLNPGDAKESSVQSILSKLNDSGNSGNLFSHGIAEYTSAGTYNWVCPDGVYLITALLASGGGAGGGSVNVNTSYNNVNKHGSGAGGSAGNVLIAKIRVVPGETYTLTVGAGGTGGKGVVYNGTWNGASSGSNGGDTSFGDIVTLIGGKGGAGKNGTSAPAGGKNSLATVISNLNYKIEVLQLHIGGDGSDGVTDRDVDGGAGGIKVTTNETYFNFVGAAGGKGANQTWTSSAYNGSDGGVGKIVLIW